MDYNKIVSNIEFLLKDKRMWYEKLEHKQVRTSLEAAEVRKNYTLAQGAKALIVRLKRDEKRSFVMIVVPGDARFDTKLTKKTLEAKDIRFASPEEVGKITGGVLPGGVPPFGNLFDLEVYVDESIFESEKIIFNAGDKRVSIGMFSEDYKTLVKPTIVSIV